MTNKIYDIAVIGGGPAGLSAAGAAASKGASVVVLEKMNTCGRKLLISGSGRCNITNTLKDTKSFISALGANGKFLYQAVNAFKPVDTVTFFNNNGLKTSVERGFKVFPAGEAGSADVLRVLMKFSVGNGAEIICGKDISEIRYADGVFHTAGFAARAVIISTGGKSYPATGSSGGGYALAESLGHNIIAPVPVLVPAYADDAWLGDVQGLSLKDAGLTLFSGGKRLCASSGDIVFTDKGISGPAVYDLSRIADTSADGLSLSVDTMPDLTLAELDKKLEEEFKLNNKKILRNIIDGYLPPKLMSVIFKVTETDGEMRASNISKKDRLKLAGFIKGIGLNGVRFAGFERAVVTKGGVDTREIDGRTMMSKLVSGLFFAGEVIDVEGPTGGYNLQICWSTGMLAGKSAAEFVKINV